MKPAAIFTHTKCEPPGYLVDLLRAVHYPFELVCLHKDVTCDFELDDFSRLIFMGGPGNVAEPEPWMLQEIEIIRAARMRKIPQLGICLGAQLMSVAFGGRVWQADAVEVGWHKVQLTAEAKACHWFDELPQQFEVFQWHAHNFSLPPACTGIATSKCTPCQGFIDGNNLAIQFHLEMTVDIIRTLINKYAEDLTGQSDCTQNRQQILQDIEQHCRHTFDVADKLLKPWLMLAD